MAEKPSKLPEWASSDDAAIAEPLAGTKAVGWVPGERPPAAEWNWWMNLVYKWAQFLDTVEDYIRALPLNWTARQTMSAGLDARAVDGNGDPLPGVQGLTVTQGAEVAGGLVVSSGGAAVTGNSSVDGTLGVTGALTVAAGGAAVTGNSTVTGTLGVSAGLTAASLTTPLAQIGADHAVFQGANPASSVPFVNTQTPKNLAKAWALITVSAAGTITVSNGFNVSSVTRPNVNQLTVALSGQLSDNGSPGVAVCSAFHPLGPINIACRVSGEGASVLLNGFSMYGSTIPFPALSFAAPGDTMELHLTVYGEQDSP